MSAHTLKHTFDLIDKDGDGTVGLPELKHAFQACGCNPKDNELRESLTEAGLDPDNLSMDYETFVRIMGISSLISKRDIKTYFGSFDLDASGYLSAAEMRHIITNMNMTADDGVVDEMVSMCDFDGDGKIQFEEFVEHIRGLGFTVGEDDIESGPSPEPPAIEEKKADDDAEEVESTTFKIDQFPSDVQSTIKLFDYKGTGEVSAADLERASELLKIEKMAGAKDPEANPSLHWKQGREKRGLGEVVYKANHIALIVSDVGRSAAFYSDVMGFQQIRRPNFDRHGAWFTMGNVELHLIKGTPLVHTGDDLIVGHISIETFDIDRVPAMLKKMNIFFRQNVSVPKGQDSGGDGTNSSNANSKIVKQYFIRDPDGYYLEICNCDVLTAFCLGDKVDLDSYEEGAPPMKLEDAGKLFSIIQLWSVKGQDDKDEREALILKARDTDRSPQALAALFGCTPAASVDPRRLSTLVTRMTVYGDICQNETEESLKQILMFSGNDVPMATRIMKLKASAAGERIVQAPAFYDGGEVLVKPNQQKMN